MSFVRSSAALRARARTDSARASAGGYRLFAGAALIEAYDQLSDSLVHRHGNRVPVSDFVAKLFCPGDGGHVFQEVLLPDPYLEIACGNRLSSIRAMVIVNEAHVHLQRAVWKVPTGSNITDNFHHGISGNRLAAIDVETGRVLRVIKGVGLDLVEAPEHPDTGQHLSGLQLPGWNSVLAFIQSGAVQMPGLRYQHWDIALSSKGPVALEINLYDPGGTDITQLTYRRGLLDDHLAALIGTPKVSANPERLHTPDSSLSVK